MSHSSRAFKFLRQIARVTPQLLPATVGNRYIAEWPRSNSTQCARLTTVGTVVYIRLALFALQTTMPRFRFAFFPPVFDVY